jgi:hypothetical protein
MADIIPHIFITNQALKKIDFENDNHKCILCSGTYSSATLFDASTYADVSAFEISGVNGYTVGGYSVDTSAYYLSADKQTVYDLDNPTWIASGGPIGPTNYAVLYNTTYENSLVYIFDFGEYKTAENGATFELNISTSGLMRSQQGC